MFKKTINFISNLIMTAIAEVVMFAAQDEKRMARRHREIEEKYGV